MQVRFSHLLRAECVSVFPRYIKTTSAFLPIACRQPPAWTVGAALDIWQPPERHASIVLSAIYVFPSPSRQTRGPAYTHSPLLRFRLKPLSGTGKTELRALPCVTNVRFIHVERKCVIRCRSVSTVLRATLRSVGHFSKQFN